MSTKMKRISILAGFTMLVVLLLVGQGLAQTALTPEQELGSFLYFDINLSEPAGQSCASCHDPDFGFVDPDSHLPVSEGVIPGKFGGRNSPASAYAMYAPIFDFEEGEGLWIGGQFWDGRATGDFLGDPLADQAIGPFENPVEIANTRLGVLESIKASDYYDTYYEPICGSLDDLSDPEIVDDRYHCVGLSIAAFERSGLFGQFSSHYDAYLAACLDAGETPNNCAQGIGKVASKVGKKYFSKEEWYGFQLFMGENNNDGILDPGEGAMCVACHVADWTAAADYALPVVVPPWAPEGMVPPVFTDFTFDNLGVPKNEEFPLTGASVDLGLGTIVGDAEENGKFKVMTLRNIGLTAPYAHNGLFKTLKEITHFYNTRDVPGSLRKGMDWDPPEYPDTVNFDELGNLGLSDADEDALVEFMKTLSDGYAP